MLPIIPENCRNPCFLTVKNAACAAFLREPNSPGKGEKDGTVSVVQMLASGIMFISV